MSTTPQKSDWRDHYDAWRRRTLPPSVNDLAWRHEDIVARLRLLEGFVQTQMEAAGSSEMQAEIVDILRLLPPHRAIGRRKTRVGSPGDGGYVQIDDIEGVAHALSFGVRDDDSWDLAMAMAGIPVEQFDHSVERAPSVHPLLAFHRKMIATQRSTQTATLEELIALHSKGERPDVILKTDIEGCEWDVLDATPESSLAKLTQILAEFHDFSQLGDIRFRARARRVFQKLSSHFALVHVHGNNCAPMACTANVFIPDVLEMSFVNRSVYAVEPSFEIFPTPLDAPNAPSRADYRLGTFLF